MEQRRRREAAKAGKEVSGGSAMPATGFIPASTLLKSGPSPKVPGPSRYTVPARRGGQPVRTDATQLGDLRGVSQSIQEVSIWCIVYLCVS